MNKPPIRPRTPCIWLATIIVAAIAPVAGRAAAQQAPPVISGVQPSTVPAYGPIKGASHVVITGTGLNGATMVEFGGVPGEVQQVFTSYAGDSITAYAPGQLPGTVFVTVTTPGGTSSVNPAALLTYVEPGAGDWTSTGPLIGPSSEYDKAPPPYAVPLVDGTVLLIAGVDSEIYSPASKTWSATRSGPVERRQYAAAAVLPGGGAFVSGGQAPSPVYENDGLSSAEIYNPQNGQWSETAYPMKNGRDYHTATPLKDGRVLVAGGFIGGMLRLPDDQARADQERLTELYDPRTGLWTDTGHLNLARSKHTATLLPDGKVLIAGGIGRNDAPGPSLGATDKPLDSAEVYDPSSGQWTLAGSLAQARYGHSASLLPGGQALVAGGDLTNSLDSRPLSSSEIFDPKATDITTSRTGAWRATGILNADRGSDHAAASMADGRILVVGGSGPRDTAEIYDPGTQRWTYTKSLVTPRGSALAATPLSTGQVLMAGGVWNPSLNGPNDVRAAELFTPPAKLPIIPPTDAPTTPPTAPPPTTQPPETAPPAVPKQVTLGPSKPVPVKQIPPSEQAGAAVGADQNKVLLIPPGTSGAPPQPTLAAQLGPAPGPGAGPATLGSFGAQPGAYPNVGAAAAGQAEPHQAPSPAYHFSALSQAAAGFLTAGVLLVLFLASIVGGRCSPKNCFVHVPGHRAEPSLAWAAR